VARRTAGPETRSGREQAAGRAAGEGEAAGDRAERGHRAGIAVDLFVCLFVWAVAVGGLRLLMDRIGLCGGRGWDW